MISNPSQRTLTATSPQRCADGPCCYICFEEGTDESGQPLVRECSCRGDSAGFVHASCLVKYARLKTEEWDGEDFGECVQLWTVCPNCLQKYQNELALHMANEFVNVVARKYPDDQDLQLKALAEKLRVLFDLLVRGSLLPVQKQEAKNVANKILSAIGEMRADNSSLLERIIHLEAFAYNCLGGIALKEPTKESAKAALKYFEKCRDISNANGLAFIAAAAESNIIVAKSFFEGSSKASREELVKKHRELYELRVSVYGEANYSTVLAGLLLAKALLDAEQMIEAKSMLTKLHHVSNRVFGPDHILTKDTERLLQNVHS